LRQHGGHADIKPRLGGIELVPGRSAGNRFRVRFSVPVRHLDPPFPPALRDTMPNLPRPATHPLVRPRSSAIIADALFHGPRSRLSLPKPALCQECSLYVPDGVHTHSRNESSHISEKTKPGNLPRVALSVFNLALERPSAGAETSHRIGVT
jgi:hypothetical protein